MINKNYYFRLDEMDRLTMELTEEKTLEECIKLTVECFNAINGKIPGYLDKSELQSTKNKERDGE